MARQNTLTKNCKVTQAIYGACLDVTTEWDEIKALDERSGARGWRSEELVSRVTGSPIKKARNFYADVELPNGRAGEVKSINRVKGMMLFDKLPISERLSYRFKRRLEMDMGGINEFEAFFRSVRYELKRSTLAAIYSDPGKVDDLILSLMRDVQEDMKEHNIDLLIVLRSHGFMAHVPHERLTDYIDLGMIWGNKLRLILKPDASLYEPRCLQPPSEWLNLA